MGELAIIAIVAAAMFVPLAWIAAGLLTLRDRYFQRAGPAETAGPWYPPKWARGRWTAWIHRILLTPLLLIALMVVLILSVPLYAWQAVVAMLSRVQRKRVPLADACYNSVGGKAGDRPMRKCSKCDKNATSHVTEVHQGTGEVKEFHLCDEHAQEQEYGCQSVPPWFDTADAEFPMADPVELAAQFVAEMERYGYLMHFDGQVVNFTPKNRQQFTVPMSGEKLLQSVYQWLGSRKISRTADDVTAVTGEIVNLLMQR
ncbi:MAG TPA: hypothetical protein VMR25_12145 [Planctomycetaceae bacterium]|jgi:hypothetical protein|nr:hypothetical protein [Planctomycetaceae bacterium]